MIYVFFSSIPRWHAACKMDTVWDTHAHSTWAWETLNQIVPVVGNSWKRGPMLISRRTTTVHISCQTCPWNLSAIPAICTCSLFSQAGTLDLTGQYQPLVVLCALWVVWIGQHVRQVGCYRPCEGRRLTKVRWMMIKVDRSVQMLWITSQNRCSELSRGVEDELACIQYSNSFHPEKDRFTMQSHTIVEPPHQRNLFLPRCWTSLWRCFQSNFPPRRVASFAVE